MVRSCQGNGADMFMYLVFDEVKSVFWYLMVYFLIVPQADFFFFFKKRKPDLNGEV